ncbi:MAG: hypothetical protein WD793_09885 [Steroidobacteraceae bacterium]
MIGDAFDRHVPPSDADDPFHDADIDAGLIQDGSLLDVQLDKGLQLARLAMRQRQPIRIAADGADPVADGHAAMADDIEGLRADAAGHRLAADHAAFLVRETDDLQRMARHNPLFAQQPGDFDGANDADVTVVVTALRNGIDMRSRHDHGQVRVATIAAADEIAGRVDPHVESRLPHQLFDVLTPGDVGGTVGEPADTAFRIGAKGRQLGDVPFDALRVGVRCNGSG